MSKKNRMLIDFSRVVRDEKMKQSRATCRELSCSWRLRPLPALLLSPCFQGRKYTNDVAKIYSINITNVVNGVASHCRPCALEASDLGSSCTSCPAGNYIDRGSGTCRPCPENTVLKAHQPYGVQACRPCGPGTRSNKVPAACRTSWAWPLANRLPGCRG